MENGVFLEFDEFMDSLIREDHVCRKLSFT